MQRVEFEIILVYRVETLSQKVGSRNEKKTGDAKDLQGLPEPSFPHLSAVLMAKTESGFGTVPESSTGMPSALCCPAWCHICFFSHEEEDITVLVSPEKPLRRGLSHRSNPNAVAPALQGVRFSLGPLSPEKLEEILDEANRLAAQLEECALKDSENAAAGPGRPSPRGKPSPRRETFVLKDSPVRDLLPTVSSWSAPPPSNLTGLRSSDKKGSARAGRVTAGKKPSSIKKVSAEGGIACVHLHQVQETLKAQRGSLPGQRETVILPLRFLGSSKQGWRHSQT